MSIRTSALPLVAVPLIALGCTREAPAPAPAATTPGVVVLDAAAQQHAGIVVAEAGVTARAARTEAPGVLALDERRTARIGSLVEGVTLDETTLIAFKRAIENAALRFADHPEDLDRLEVYEALVSIAREAHVHLDMRRVQNTHYRLRAAVRPAIAAANNGHSSRRWLELFDTLGEKLAIA